MGSGLSQSNETNVLEVPHWSVWSILLQYNNKKNNKKTEGENDPI